MATLPLSGSNIKFLTGVPFANDYKNTIRFEDTTAQYNYFINRKIVHTMTEASFVRDEGKGYISANAPIDSLLETNYLMFQNAQYNSKWFYAFVTKLERKSQGTTYVYFELDVYQTWLKDFTFKPSFVVREHCPLWNADGSPVVNTVDEGLNYGLEYDDVYVQHFTPNNGVKFVVVVTQDALQEDGKKKATYNGTATPLSYYVIPVTIDGQDVFVKIGSEEVVMSSPTEILEDLYSNEKATNNIVSIYMTDSIGCPFNVTEEVEGFKHITFTEKDQKFEITPLPGNGTALNCLYVKDVKRYMTETFALGDKYSYLPNYKESKLYMYPYTVLTMDDFKGNRHDYKLEHINSPDIFLNMKGSMGTSNKVSYGIQKYNDNANMTNHQDNQYALINNTPQDIPVLNNMLSAFLQGKRNSIENSKDTIMWNTGMGMLGSATGAAGSAMQGGKFGALGTIQGVSNIVKGAGDGVLQLQAIEAKQQDIANLPSQLSKQGSNTAYDFGHRYDGVTLIKKTVKPEYQKKLTDFFNMYGYKKNEVKIPNFHTRQNWNYVQTTNCNIVGNFNNEDLNELKAVFDNGITLWHTTDVGNYSLSNEVI